MDSEKVEVPRSRLFTNRNKGIALIALLLFLLSFVLFLRFTKDTSRNLLNSTSLAEGSTVIKTKSTYYISLQKDAGYLYKSQKKGFEAVKDFINTNPTFDKNKRLLPGNFLSNSTLVKSSKDNTDPFLQKNNIPLTSEHFMFEQKINNISVYASSLTVHVRNNNEIYNVSGSLLNNTDIAKDAISQETAQRIALEKARAQAPKLKLKVASTKKYIVNKNIIGVPDRSNHSTLDVLVSEDAIPSTFATEYFVDLATGEIVLTNEKVEQMLNRAIFDCNGNLSCPDVLIRPEGAPASNIPDGDNAYDQFYAVYSFFKDNFGRDSFDNQGAQMKGYIRYPFPSPNALWNGQIGSMVFGNNLVLPDVTGHEITHAVTQYAASLVYQFQSGALNESISDIFGSNMDNNWIIGESSVFGATGVRNMQDPPLKNQPDKLFAANYFCALRDYGGVHYNSGVMNKAYYLMVDGGSFNNCSLAGIGRASANKVIYRAYTYLTPSANFKDMYNAVNAACNDVFGAGSAECITVKKAMKAVEMDQQPAGSSISPVCAGGVPATTSCDISNETPTPTFTPTPPLITLTPIPAPSGWCNSNDPGCIPPADPNPTRFPGSKVSMSGYVFIDTNNNRIKDAGESGYGPAAIVYRGPQNGDTVAQATNGFYDTGANLDQGTYIFYLQLINASNQRRMIMRVGPEELRNTKTKDFPIPPGIIDITPTPTSASILTPTPTSSGGGGSGGNPSEPVVLYECHEATRTQTVNGKPIQISKLECTPISQ